MTTSTDCFPLRPSVSSGSRSAGICMVSGCPSLTRRQFCRISMVTSLCSSLEMAQQTQSPLRSSARKSSAAPEAGGDPTAMATRRIGSAHTIPVGFNMKIPVVPSPPPPFKDSAHHIDQACFACLTAEMASCVLHSYPNHIPLPWPHTGASAPRTPSRRASI